MKYIKLNRRGFSLVELIVVIAIMAVLAGVVTGSVFSQLNKSKDETAKIEQGHLIRDIRDECLEAKNLGRDSDINLEHMLKMLESDFPDMVSFTEKGKSAEHKYLVEYDGTTNIFSVSFILLGSGNKGKTYIAKYNHETQETSYEIK